MTSPYTDAILRIIGGRARGTLLGISSAEQTAASLMARSFVSADISGAASEIFTGERLSTMANEIILAGQTIWRRMNGDIRWVQACTVASRTGNYRISGRSYDPKSILHCRLNVDMMTGQGRPDLEIAIATRDFIRNLENNLSDEAQDPYGYLIPTQAYEDESLKELITEIDGSKLLVEPETTNYMGSPTSASSRDEWQQRRVGFEAPEAVRRWYESARMSALSILGVPPGLYSPDADASAAREAWRLYIFTVVDPMAKLLEQAAGRCGLEIDMNFDRLMASDIANRARAYGTLVSGNMDEDEAARLTGFAR